MKRQNLEKKDSYILYIDLIGWVQDFCQNPDITYRKTVDFYELVFSQVNHLLAMPWSTFIGYSDTAWTRIIVDHDEPSATEVLCASLGCVDRIIEKVKYSLFAVLTSGWVFLNPDDQLEVYEGELEGSQRAALYKGSSRKYQVIPNLGIAQIKAIHFEDYSKKNKLKNDVLWVEDSVVSGDTIPQFRKVICETVRPEEGWKLDQTAFSVFEKAN